MMQCQGCSLKFPCLNLLQCGKCSKKDKAGSSTDCDVIDVSRMNVLMYLPHNPWSQKQPQCLGCGIIYPWLQKTLWGTCELCSDTGTFSMSAFLLYIMFIPSPEPNIFHGNCLHCLCHLWHDHSFFSGHAHITKYLMDCVKSFDGKASKHCLNQCAQNPALQLASKVKEKLTLLKKQNKLDGVDVSVQLWIYLESKNGAVKKVCTPGWHSIDGTKSLWPRLNYCCFLLISMVVSVLIICLTRS